MGLRTGTLRTATVCGVLLIVAGCGQVSEESGTAAAQRPVIRSWEFVDGFPEKIAVFDTVFWEPRDTTSLRELIQTTDLVKGKQVLEIGTGSGLVSLCCLRAGAARVVATDVNAAAIRNATYNARNLEVDDRFEARQVPLDDPSAYRVLRPTEQFDLIISNPPWENRRPANIDEYALYDPGFALLESILADLRTRLKPGGKAFLAYGAVDAVEHALELGPQFELQVSVLDDRSIADLPETFLPGMLLEISPQRRQ